MALTVGSIGVFEPYSRLGGKSPAPITMHMANSTVIQYGDVLTFDAATGKVSSNNAVAATGNPIAGVALETRTAPAAAGDSDTILVAPATAEAIFVGTLVTNTTTDDTPLFTDVGDSHDIAEDVSIASGGGGTGGPLIIGATSSPVVKILGFAPEQLRGATFTSGSSGTVNPRVLFKFLNAESHFALA